MNILKHQKTRINLFLTLAVLAITALSYSNIFKNEFIGDDFDFITRWSATHSIGNVPELLMGNLPDSHIGTYRPVRSLAYLTAYQLWGQNVFLYHSFSLVVHLLATCLVILVLSSLTKNKWVSLSAGLLFGTHPIHTEAVTFVTASFDTLAFVFLFTSLYLYITGHDQKNSKKYLLSILFATLAFFTNEQTLIFPLVLASYHFFYNYRSKPQLKKLIPFFAASGIYTFLRFGLLKITSRGESQFPDILSALLTSAKSLLKYILTLFYPSDLNVSHTLWGNISTYTFPELNRAALLGQSILEPPVLLTLFILIASGFFIFKQHKHYPDISFALTWIFVSFLPVMNFFPSSLIYAERYAYLPSFGFVLLIPLVWFAITSRLHLSPKLISILSLVIFIAISSLYFFKTYTRNMDWRSEITFWQSAVENDPDNPTVHFQMAKVYQVRLMLDEASAAYSKTIEINPNFPPAYYHLATIKDYQEDIGTATTYYQQALELDPANSQYRRSLAKIYTKQADISMQKNQINQAMAMYAQASSVDPSFAEAAAKRQDLCKKFPQYCK